MYNELTTISGLDYHKLKQALTIFEKLFLVKFITPYYTNKRIEISKNPKVFFLDTGLRSALLGDFKPLQERIDKGSLYENYIFCAFHKKDKNVKYYRSKSGAEIDFIIEDCAPVEVKSKLSQKKVSRSFQNYIDKYHPIRGIIFNENLSGTINHELGKVLFLPHFMAEKSML